MTSFRGYSSKTNSSNITIIIINNITRIINNSLINPNMTTDELTLLLGDPTITDQSYFTSITDDNLVYFGICLATIILLLSINKSHILYVRNLVRNI